VRRRLDRHDLAAALLVLLGAFLFAREIGNDFLWGHDGGNGAPYWYGAENALRFRTLAHLKGGFGAAEVPAYTHHPPLLHLHLVASRLLFGRGEWAGRLVPFGYGVATLILLYRTARRWWSPAFALVALALYLAVPLHLIFASMIDHEQGAIFWTLAAASLAIEMSVHPIERRGARAVRRLTSGLAIATLMALGWAWASYCVLGVLGAILSVQWLRAPRTSPFRRRLRRVLAVLASAAAVSAAVFVLVIVLSNVPLAEQRAAFSHRVATPEGYVGAMFERATNDLYGPAMLGLSAAGLVRLVRRVLGARTRTRDALAASFVLGQALLSWLFPNAGLNHAYWTFTIGVGLALLAADAALAFARWAARGRRRALLIVGTAAGLLVLGGFALARQSWGLETGHAAYAPAPFDDQFEEVQAARWLCARFGSDVSYLLSERMPVREEVFYYLDAPSRRGSITARWADGPGGRPCRARVCVVVADLRRESDDASRTALRALTASHPTILLARHLVAIDLAASGPAALESVLLETSTSGPLYAWFVNGRHGPSRWVADPQPTAARDLLPRAGVVEIESIKEGRATWERCSPGAVVTAIERTPREGAPAGLRAVCRREGEPGDAAGDGAVTRWLGADGPASVAACPAGEAVVGLAFPSGGSAGWSAARPVLAELSVLCSQGGTPPSAGAYVLRCAPGGRAVGLGVRSAETRAEGGSVAGITGVGLACLARD